MPRTNRHKLPRRFAKSTQLIFGEGFEDKPWLKHLRSLYAQNTNIASKVDCGSGGCPKDIVEAAKRKANGERVIVIMDGDKPAKEYKAMQEVLDDSPHMSVEIITPCTEALLLAILNEGVWPKKKSPGCKSEFEKRYINEKKRRDQTAYARVFPKKLLDEMRTKVPQLEKIIQIFTGHRGRTP